MRFQSIVNSTTLSELAETIDKRHHVFTKCTFDMGKLGFNNLLNPSFPVYESNIPLQ